MTTRSDVFAELLALADGNPRQHEVFAARWLLRGIVAHAKLTHPALESTEFERLEHDRLDEEADQRVQTNGSSALWYLKDGQRLTPRRHQHIVRAGREADAIEILTAQGRLDQWPRDERTGTDGQ